MTRFGVRSGLSLACSGLLLCAVSWTSPAQAGNQVAWFWEWSDGVTAQSRTLPEARYSVWSRLPTITVASAPPAPGRPVRLQIREPSGWTTEDTARTDSQGRAELTINPYCRDGDWCADTIDYRIVADADQASVRVTFTPRRTSP